jgi:hypothetical protein
MIFIFSFSAIISRNFIEIKQPDNAKTIISQSINWIADIQKVSFVIIEQNANPQSADKQSLDNLLPFKNIEINDDQLQLSQNDLLKIFIILFRSST